MIGLFSFLILEEERYIEMLACLSRSLNAYEEIGEHLQANYKRFQADFVFHPANALLRAMLTQRNAAFYTEQQQMILSDEHIVTDAAGIQPLSRRYKDQYLSLHGTDTYWTGDRLMEAGDRFRVLLAIDGDEVVGYIDVTVCYEDNEPVDLLVEGSHRRKGWGRKLLAKAIEMNRPKGMKLMVDVDNRPAIALYESLGFVKATGQNSQTATWHIP